MQVPDFARWRGGRRLGRRRREGGGGMWWVFLTIFWEGVGRCARLRCGGGGTRRGRGGWRAGRRRWEGGGGMWWVLGRHDGGWRRRMQAEFCKKKTRVYVQASNTANNICRGRLVGKAMSVRGDTVKPPERSLGHRFESRRGRIGRATQRNPAPSGSAGDTTANPPPPSGSTKVFFFAPAL